MPSSDWFTWLLTATAGLYVSSALLVIGARARHEQRCILLDRLRALGERPSGAVARAPGSRLVANTPLDIIERCLYEMRASDEVLQACAEEVVSRVGTQRLARQAARGFRTWRRIAAMRALAFSESTEAWPLLKRAIEQPDREAVQAAVVTLGHLSNQRSAELLIYALGRVPFGRAQIATFLEAYPADIVSLIWPLLDESSPILRYWGATLAARYASQPRVEQRLRTLTDDADASVRKAAVSSLAAAACRDSLPVVLKLLDDAVPFVRAHAILAIGRLEVFSLAPVVSLKLSDHDWSTREAAKLVLESFGHHAELAVLERLAEDDDFARDGAAEILRNIGTLERLVDTSDNS